MRRAREWTEQRPPRQRSRLIERAAVGDGAVMVAIHHCCVRKNDLRSHEHVDLGRSTTPGARRHEGSTHGKWLLSALRVGEDICSYYSNFSLYS